MTGLHGLRILLVGPVPPPAGGMAGQTRQLRELLQSAGAEVDLLPTNRPYRPAWVARWRGLRAVVRLLAHLAALWPAVARAQVVHVMANSGWSWHLFAAPAVWVAWLRGVPVVVNYRGGEAGAFLARRPAVVRATMRRCAALVVPSAFLERVFSGHGMPASIVPNIVDTVRFAPPPRGQPRAARQLAVVRNLEPIYGNDIALRAFARVHARHPDARLVIAGTGPERAALQALAGELGIGESVRFAGRLERDEVAALLRDSTLAVNPTRVDNMPNSVLEAMASGLPVVSTNVGGVPYIVEDGLTGVLVPADDPEALAAAVLRLLDDPAAAGHLAAAALQAVQRCTWDSVGPQWAAVYRSALAARAARSA